MAAKKQDLVTDIAESADAPAMNQAESDQTTAADPVANEQTVSVRILVDHVVDGTLHACNSVAEFPASVAAALVRNGIADDHPEAVAAAK